MTKGRKPASSVKRGEIYTLDLSSRGGTLKKERPVLVIQNDVGNLRSPQTIVAAIRDSRGGKSLPIFVSVPKGTGGLKKDSVVDTGHIVTVLQEDLTGKPSIGRLPGPIMNRVDFALQVSLDLLPNPSVHKHTR